MTTTPNETAVEYTGRYHCKKCGYINKDQLDLNSNSFNLHCKCGGKVVRTGNESIAVIRCRANLRVRR